jgi:hypothetical protein
MVGMYGELMVNCPYATVPKEVLQTKYPTLILPTGVMQLNNMSHIYFEIKELSAN